MTVVAGFGLGLVAGGISWWIIRGLIARPPFLRENFRGSTIPIAGGLALIGVVLIGDVAASALNRFWITFTEAELDVRRATLVVVIGFGLLGLLDDLAGESGTSGYRGHLEALLSGEVTTGALKIAGGVVVAVAGVVIAVDEGIVLLILDAALVALTANFANLLDRRPGRTIKVVLAAFAVVAVASVADPLVAPLAVVAGGATVLAVPDLREQMMLGDTGSNPLGAAVALAVVAVFPPVVRLVLLVVVLGLNLLSERVSFSAVIDRNRVLRGLDRAGGLDRNA